MVENRGLGSSEVKGDQEIRYGGARLNKAAEEGQSAILQPPNKIEISVQHSLGNIVGANILSASV